jgi:ParB-like nuclease domain
MARPTHDPVLTADARSARIADAPIEGAATQTRAAPLERSTASHIAPQLRALVVPIDCVELHPRNPRRGDVAAVAASLARFGQVKPVVVQQSTGYVIAGNHVLRAALSLGWTEIAANVEDLDDAESMALMLANNRTADLGGYDDTLLARSSRSSRQRTTSTRRQISQPRRTCTSSLARPGRSGATSSCAGTRPSPGMSGGCSGTRLSISSGRIRPGGVRSAAERRRRSRSSTTTSGPTGRACSSPRRCVSRRCGPGAPSTWRRRPGPSCISPSSSPSATLGSQRTRPGAGDPPGAHGAREPDPGRSLSAPGARPHARRRMLVGGALDGGGPRG